MTSTPCPYPRYGLTCGYWTNRPSKLDRHVLAHAQAGKADDLYDLTDTQYAGEKLHQCREGVTSQ